MGGAHGRRQQGRAEQAHRHGWVSYPCLWRLCRESSVRCGGQSAHDGRCREQCACHCSRCSESVCTAYDHGRCLRCKGYGEGRRGKEEYGSDLGRHGDGQCLRRCAHGCRCDEGRGGERRRHLRRHGDGQYLRQCRSRCGCVRQGHKEQCQYHGRRDHRRYLRRLYGRHG